MYRKIFKILIFAIIMVGSLSTSIKAIDSILQEGTPVRKAYRQTSEENQALINTKLLKDLENDQAGLTRLLTGPIEVEMAKSQIELNRFKRSCDNSTGDYSGRSDENCFIACIYSQPRTWGQCLSSTAAISAMTLVCAPFTAVIAGGVCCYKTRNNKAKIKEMEEEIENSQHTLQQYTSTEEDSLGSKSADRHEQICNAISALLQEDKQEKRKAMKILSLLKPEEKKWIETHVAETMDDLGILTQ